MHFIVEHSHILVSIEGERGNKIAFMRGQRNRLGEQEGEVAKIPSVLRDVD